MEQETGNKGRRTAAEDRENRLKAALKANIARRKAQARARQRPDSASGQDEEQADGFHSGQG